MSRLWIKEVRAIRPGGEVSSISFTKGLNTIVGPSNTGKSRVAKTIMFACGGRETPFTEKSGYEIAEVDFVTEAGEVTFSRSIRRTSPIEVTSTDPQIESGLYAITDRASKPLKNVLLLLLGFEPGRKVITNEAFHKSSLTWNSLKHLFFVAEGDIGRAEPTLLVPPKTNHTTRTQALSSLLVLAQDLNFDELTTNESASERSARKRAVSAFIHHELGKLDERIKAAEERQSQPPSSVVDRYLDELNTQLRDLFAQRSALVEQDAFMLKQLTELEEYLLDLEVRIHQQETLRSQYTADIARLEFIREDLMHRLDHPVATTCGFCSNEVPPQQIDPEDIDSIDVELGHIHALQTGVDQSLSDVRSAYGVATEQYADIGRQREAQMAAIQQTLAPEIDRIQKVIHQLQAAHMSQEKLASLQSQKEMFKRALDDLEQPTEAMDKFRPMDLFEPDFFYSMRRNMQEILGEANFPGSSSVDFDRQSLDIEIAGDSKAEEQGKGYSAYLNSVLILAFHEYLNQRSAHPIGFLLIDTPLHGFDQGEVAVENSMREGLFKRLTQQAQDQQIIVIENTDKLAGIDEALLGNKVTFTKRKTNGRYGYLEGVYDVSEQES